MSIKYAKNTLGYIDDDGIKHEKAGAIPIVVAKCGSYLKKEGEQTNKKKPMVYINPLRIAMETEGIFRISGSIKRIKALEIQFDQSSTGYGTHFNWEGYTVHDAASLLRRYLNALPEPVIPFDYYQKFRDVMSKCTNVSSCLFGLTIP
jgi:hypothetical protein